MPMVTNIGQGQHRFQLGRGLYTASPGLKGKVPTPSQIARGVDPGDTNSRWWALSADTKRQWGAVAQPGMSGRRLYSVQNRLRWNDFAYPTDTPEDAPYTPGSVPVSAISATTNYEGSGIGAYIFSAAGVPGTGVYELAVYKPGTGVPGRGGSGAYWLLAGWGAWDSSPTADFPVVFGGNVRGPNAAFWTAPTWIEGDNIRVRLIFGTLTHYPSPAQFFSLVVGPPVP